MTRQRTTLMLFLVLIVYSPAMADDLICDNTPLTPFTGSADNVEVPPGARCFLLGANVDNVKVFGSLAANTTVIRGNVQGEPGHGFVRLGPGGGGNTVQGNVQIKGGVGGVFLGAFGDNSLVWGTIIQGNVDAKRNLNGLVFLDTMIGGNLKVKENTGIITPGFPFSASIGGNTIGGNLQCTSNSPPPIVSPSAGPNTVGGKKKDQCSTDLGF